MRVGIGVRDVLVLVLCVFAITVGVVLVCMLVVCVLVVCVLFVCRVVGTLTSCEGLGSIKDVT